LRVQLRPNLKTVGRGSNEKGQTGSWSASLRAAGLLQPTRDPRLREVPCVDAGDDQYGKDGGRAREARRPLRAGSQGSQGEIRRTREDGRRLPEGRWRAHRDAPLRSALR